MDSRFEAWMLASGNGAPAARSYLSNLRRIEAAYGDVDALHEMDGFASTLRDLAYSSTDARNGSPNSSRIPVEGDLYNGLATLRSTLNKYARFRQEVARSALPDVVDDGPAASVIPSGVDARELTFSLERDMQAALRRSIGQLESGLEIVDGGAEQSVPSGRIDILAKDPSGAMVVIELKAVRANRDAVAQTLAYMGDVQEQTDGDVRGILVAPEFDSKAVSAARVVPVLRLVTYAFSFSFTAMS